MKSNFLKKGIIVAAFLGAMLIPNEEVYAAEGITIAPIVKQELNTKVDATALTSALAEVKKETSVEKTTIKIESKEEMQFKGLFADNAFADVSGEYLLVNVEADEESDWSGKLYEANAVEILEREGEWSLVRSGNVEGYVLTSNLLTGKDAVAFAKELLTEEFPETDIYTLTEAEIFESFSVGETKEEEQVRLEEEEKARKAAEEAARKAAEEAKRAAEEAKKAAEKARRQEVVDYAKQFVGNPYVWGGTSLTRGADCSGFVMSVYEHFGVSLPHSSYAMRGYGKSVKVSDMQPGDIVCYAGHVAIYAGNGNIVHAQNARTGITVSSAYYANIITVRRVY